MEELGLLFALAYVFAGMLVSAAIFHTMDPLPGCLVIAAAVTVPGLAILGILYALEEHGKGEA